MHTHHYKIVKLLQSFKIIIIAPTCFGLCKPLSGSSQPVLRQSYSVDLGYISLYEVIGIVATYLFRPVMCVDRALCKVSLYTVHDPYA